MKTVSSSLAPTRCGNTEFRWGERTYVMGIINLSPDSFSGDGLGGNVEAAVTQARRLIAEGADILDIGGESTRPGKAPKPVNDFYDELRLVIPVIERLAREFPIPLSIDTYKSEVAGQAVRAGAGMINDIWGLKRDPAIARVAVEANVPLILVSNQRDACSKDIMAEVIADLRRSIDRATETGVAGNNIIIDPGIGFGKSLKQNLEIIRCLAELRSLGRPILLGASRKLTIGLEPNASVEQRLEGTAAAVAIGIANGADMVRVHDVGQMVRVCRVSDAIVRSRSVER